MYVRGDKFSGIAVPLLCLWGGSAVASPALPLLDISADPTLLDTQVIPDDSDRLSAALVKSGIDLDLGTQLFQLDTAYYVHGRLATDTAAAPRDAFSEQLSAKLRSQVLDNLLGMNFGVDANGVMREGGDVYQSRVAPMLSAPISDLAHLDFSYEYVLDKPTADAVATLRSGYSVQFQGGLPGGRLSWTGRYSTADSFVPGSDTLLNNLESLSLSSTYRVSDDLQLRLSAAQESLHTLDTLTISTRQQRYHTALSWSPSPDFSLAVNLGTLEHQRLGERDTFGGGQMSWKPLPDLQIKLSYGLQAAAESAAWMFSTRYVFGG